MKMKNIYSKFNILALYLIITLLIISCDNSTSNNAIDCDILSIRCSLEDVQYAVNNSNDGDVVGIPAGYIT